VDKPFYVAEDYHQDYMTKHPTQPYIVINDLPKLDNLPKLTKNEVTVQPLILKLLKLSKAQKNLQGSYAEFALLIGV